MCMLIETGELYGLYCLVVHFLVLCFGLYNREQGTWCNKQMLVVSILRVNYTQSLAPDLHGAQPALEMLPFAWVCMRGVELHRQAYSLY